MNDDGVEGGEAIRIHLVERKVDDLIAGKKRNLFEVTSPRAVLAETTSGLPREANRKLAQGEAAVLVIDIEHSWAG